ncbi:hypothetical protein DFS34DRAFT_327644 [Phlyctochytrium arcticum]|nr:hypothetical protein DFS34DRAFT_327644 [Phlyctochytrium arcticum]
MFSTTSTKGGGTRFTRTKATVTTTKKSDAGPEQDTPTVRQRLAEARKTGVLDLRSLELKGLPVDAERLKNITALLLGDNRLTAVPDLKFFPRLTYLDISQNKISSIPTSLADLADLEILDVEGNAEVEDKLPPAVRVLVDRGRLAVLGGAGNVTADDVGGVAVEESDGSSEPESEKEEAWRKDYYDTDDEAEVEEGGYEDDEEPGMAVDSNSDNDDNDNSRQETVTTDHLDTEFQLFLHRIEGLDTESGSEFTSEYRKRWSSGDPSFVRYVAKRYGADAGKETTRGVVGKRAKDRRKAGGDAAAGDSDGDDEAPSSRGGKRLVDKNAKRQMDYARKSKEKFVKQDVKAGRKSKSAKMDIA